MLLSTPAGPEAQAVTFHGLHWPSARSAGAPFTDAHVHDHDETIALTEVTLVGGHALCDLPLVESIRWDQVGAAVIVHLPNGWETLLVAGKVDGVPVAVSVPTAALRGHPGGVELARNLAFELQILLNAARMTTMGDNLDELLAVVDQGTDTPPPAPAAQRRPVAVTCFGPPRWSIHTRP